MSELNDLKARTTALLTDKEHPLPNEVRAVIESWRDCSYHNYYLYVEVCEAYQELELRYHEMGNEGHTSIFEKFGVCIMAVFEKVFTMFRRTK